MVLLKRSLMLLVVASLGFSLPSEAKDGLRTIQIHARTGFLSGNYGGVFSGSFSLTAPIDLDFEFFFSHELSYLFRFIQGMDSPDSRPFYTYAGIGTRRYFLGRGEPSEQSSDTLMVSSRPTFRAYVGGDLGISQVLVKSFGPTVQAVANMLDVGLNVGGIYQMTRSFGLEAQAGASFGYGISSTAANGTTMRGLLGILYVF